MAGKRQRYRAECKAKVAPEAISGETTLAALMIAYGAQTNLILETAGDRRDARGVFGDIGGGSRSG